MNNRRIDDESVRLLNDADRDLANGLTVPDVAKKWCPSTGNEPSRES